MWNVLRYARIGKLAYQMLSRGTLSALVHAVWVCDNEGQCRGISATKLEKKLRRLHREMYGEAG